MLGVGSVVGKLIWSITLGFRADPCRFFFCPRYMIRGLEGIPGDFYVCPSGGCCGVVRGEVVSFTV